MLEFGWSVKKIWMKEKSVEFINENSLLGMKKSTDVMQYNKFEWTDWTVE